MNQIEIMWVIMKDLLSQESPKIDSSEYQYFEMSEIILALKIASNS